MTEPARHATSRGQILVISAVAMLVLLAMLGLALDGGRGYWERRQAQNAAEHAALAAAWEHCWEGHPDPANRDPLAKATAAAADNGFTHDGATVWVTVTSPATGVFEVVVHSQLRATFAAIMGFQTITAAGRAVADCRSTSGNGFVLFAGGDTCEDAAKLLEISGPENIFNGKVHSNAGIYVGASENEFLGGTTYVGSAFLKESENTYNPEAQLSGPEPWPVAFNAADFKQKAIDEGHFKEGDMSWDWIDDHGGEGVYYATGKIDLGVSGIAAKVTLVSEDEVIINGSNQMLEPAVDGANLLAFSAVVRTVNERCSKQGVTMNGSTNQWEGFIYAPFSNIKMDGSTGSALTGSLIGWSIKVSGQALNNTADPSYFAGPPVLRLVE